MLECIFFHLQESCRFVIVHKLSFFVTLPLPCMFLMRLGLCILWEMYERQPFLSISKFARITSEKKKSVGIGNVSVLASFSVNMKGAI